MTTRKTLNKQLRILSLKKFEDLEKYCNENNKNIIKIGILYKISYKNNKNDNFKISLKEYTNDYDLFADDILKYFEKNKNKIKEVWKTVTYHELLNSLNVTMINLVS